MYMLQLFDAADEAQPIDARLLRGGSMRIGRDASADWPIADPDCELSRAHCELAASEDMLLLRSLGANGVFNHQTGTRFPNDEEVAVPLPATLRFGRFRLRATHAPHGDEAVDGARTMVLTPPLGASMAVPADWSDAGNMAPPSGSGSLLEAFCEGAGLDASLLSSEEPEEIMRRAGAVYRQMVLGVGDLMAERDRARARYKLSRTTISGTHNNPFKWAPTQRLAIDLLLAGSGSFLSGPAALQSSFRDIKRHLIATFAGLHGSLRAAVLAFEPARLTQAVTLRKSFLDSRATVLAEEIAERYADLSGQLAGGEGDTLEHAFVAAYDAAEATAVGAASA